MKNQPIASFALPGMEAVEQERAAAAAEQQGKDLTEAMLRTVDISGKSGKMEREAPLFFGTGENPLLF